VPFLLYKYSMHRGDRSIKLVRHADGVLRPKKRRAHLYLKEEDESQLRTKEGIAYLIAASLNRLNKDSDPQAGTFLIAALSLLQMSNGNDQLMSVARRLATKGASMGNRNVSNR